MFYNSLQFSWGDKKGQHGETFTVKFHCFEVYFSAFMFPSLFLLFLQLLSFICTGYQIRVSFSRYKYVFGVYKPYSHFWTIIFLNHSPVDSSISHIRSSKIRATPIRVLQIPFYYYSRFRDVTKFILSMNRYLLYNFQFLKICN